MNTTTYPCHEDEVLDSDGVCHNFEEVPFGVTVVADWCTAVDGTGFCAAADAVVIERPAPATELARTGTEANLALLGLALILFGRFLIGLATLRRTK